MDYEEFKERMQETPVEMFSIAHVVHSDSQMLHPLVRKIAENIWYFGYYPPGAIFSILTDYEINELRVMFKALDKENFDSEDELSVFALKHATFNLATLVQVLLVGEGDVTAKKNVEEIRHYMSILENLVKVETTFRKGIGIALRHNYSFLDINKPIFSTGEQE